MELFRVLAHALSDRDCDEKAFVGVSHRLGKPYGVLKENIREMTTVCRSSCFLFFSWNDFTDTLVLLTYYFLFSLWRVLLGDDECNASYLTCMIFIILRSALTARRSLCSSIGVHRGTRVMPRITRGTDGLDVLLAVRINRSAK